MPLIDKHFDKAQKNVAKEQEQAQSPKVDGMGASPVKNDRAEEKQQSAADNVEKEQKRARVKQWLSLISTAKKKQKDVFDEMRKSMKFAAGYQWPGQKKRNDGRVVINITNRAVNAKVAALYSRNPQAEYQRRKRLDFQIYNGKLESIVPLVQGAMTQPMGLAALPLEQRAMLLDFQHGMETREMIDKVGKTLEILFQTQLDEQEEEEGDFKLQMKQLVRRVITSKVGYIRISFVRDIDAIISSSGVGNTTSNRMLQLRALAERMEKGEFGDTDPRNETMRNLMTGLGGVMQDRIMDGDLKERIVYDCLPSTSVLVDPRCRQLKGFIGAKWIAVEYVLPLSDVQAIFGEDVKSPSAGGGQRVSSREHDEAKSRGDELSSIYEIFDKRNKTSFFIADGHKDYLVEPEYLTPGVRGFWPIGALTFNDVEADPDADVSPFPPSDVELMMDSQRSYNTSRDELRKHRKANRPRWMVERGMLTEDDKTSLEDSDTNDTIEIQGVPVTKKIGEVFTPIPTQPIRPELYETDSALADVAVTTGSQQEFIGASSAQKGTATGQSIAEQSRMTVTGSNIDDLDDLLTWLAKCSSELMLQSFSRDTVTRVVGPGAVWPDEPKDKMMFLSQIYLVTKAASSGRPNKAIEMRNWQLAAPVLQAAGASPMFMVRETLRRLDDNLDPEQAFPLLPQGNPAAAQASQMPAGGDHQPSLNGAHEPGVTEPPPQNRPGPALEQANAEHNPPSSQGSSPVMQ